MEQRYAIHPAIRETLGGDLSLGTGRDAAIRRLRMYSMYTVSTSLPQDNMLSKEKDLEAERKEHVSVLPGPHKLTS
jgi:hypothetical protein